MPCRSAISRWVRRFMRSNCSLAKVPQIARSAGASVQLMAREGIYAQIRLPQVKFAGAR